MSIATQTQQDGTSTTEHAPEQDGERLEGRRGWVHSARHWITVGAAEGSYVRDEHGTAFTHSDVVVPPKVGDRVRLTANDGTVLDGFWMAATELLLTRGAILEATVFTVDGSIETREVNVSMADHKACRVTGDPLASAEVVRRLVSQLAYAGEATRTAQLQFEHRIDRIVDEAHRYANDQDWCSEFDDAMEHVGLPRRKQDYELKVTVPVTVYMTVEAESYEAAREDVDLETVWDRIDRDSLDMDAAEIEESY